MATNLEKPDLKKQFRAMVQGSQNLTVAYIGVVNGLFAALKQLDSGDVAAIATATRMDAGYVRRWCDAAFAFGYLEAEGEVLLHIDTHELTLGILKEHADFPPDDNKLLLRHRLPLDPHRGMHDRVFRQDPVEMQQQRRFPGPVRTDDADTLPLLHAEADTV